MVAHSVPVRRGLPRTPGGDPWPADRLEVAVVLPGGSDASASPAVSAGSAPTIADAPRVRRGLPRTSGGAPWPAADVRPPVVSARAASAGAASTPPRRDADAAVARTLRRSSARRGLPRQLGAEGWPPAGTLLEAAVPGWIAAAGGALQESPAVDHTDPQPSVPAPREDRRAAPPVPAAAEREVRPARRRIFGVDAVTAVIVGGTLAVVLVASVVLIVRVLLWGTPAGRDFVARYPGEVPLPAWAPEGFPAWVMWQHWLNAFFMVLVIKTGWTIRRTSRPMASWQSRRGGRKIPIEQFIHVFLDMFWLANGIVFVVLLFSTGQWIRVVPFSWEFLPNAVSSALQYVSLSWPTEDGWVNYNALQVLAYFTTIFLAAPLAAITGLRMSALWPARAERLSRIFPVEVARKVHFPVMLYFVLFVLVHVFLVFATGALRNLNHMYWGTQDDGSWAGFTVFAIGMVAIVGAAVALRPVVTTQVASLFGRVGR
ncbi:thiosulfate reductase cytochrome b subunit [Microbacterium sp. SLBN-111]